MGVIIEICVKHLGVRNLIYVTDVTIILCECHLPYDNG
jgi:hypothetical protein